MSRIVVSPTSGLVLDLDAVPANPVKVDPLTKAPLDEAAVNELFPAPVDTSQESYVHRQTVRAHHLAAVKALKPVKIGNGKK